MSPTAIVLHGPTSSGKSTLAKALQSNSSTPVFHISLDVFRCMSNQRDMRSESERSLALNLHAELLQGVLRRVARTHFDIVLDLVLRDESELAACLDALSPRPTFVIGVWCPLEVLEARERARGDRGIGMAREQFGHVAYDRAYSVRIDTATVSPEEGARMIREFVQISVLQKPGQ